MSSRMYPDAPRVAVGAVVIHQNKVLLVLRNQPPAQDMWAIPGGGVNLGETLQAAAERELWEETGLRIKAGEVIYAFDAIVCDTEGRVQFHYVILDLLAEALGPTQLLTPGDDVRDAAWFGLDDLNRPDLAISDTTLILLRKIFNGS